ncbi:MAG: hypothetical protein AAF386_07690, partial [Pseudomonadota bacterium]
IWYSVAAAALVGGTFDYALAPTAPWDAAVMGCGILTGPDMDTRGLADHAILHSARATIQVATAPDLYHVLTSTDFAELAKNGQWAIDTQTQSLAPLFDRLAGLIGHKVS